MDCRLFSHIMSIIVTLNFEFSRAEQGRILQRKQGDSSWQWLTFFKFRTGTGWSRDGVTGSYVICDIASTATNHTDSWLISEFIQSNGAKEVTVSVTFTTRECPAIYPYCVQYYNIFAHFADQHLAGGVTKQSIIDGDFTFIANANATFTWKSGQSPQNNIINVTQVLTKKGLYLAFQDIGTCTAIKEITVTYKYCPSVTTNGVIFNETFAPALRDVELNVKGLCLEQSTPYPKNGLLLAKCLASGDWKMDNNMACLCNSGFEAIHGKCKACSDGMYKAILGNHACIQCPGHTHSSQSRDQCVCDSGYYRAADDLANSSCSAPPSQPTDLKITMVSPNVALAMWSPPIDNGGRKDVKYDVVCSRCISKICGYVCHNVTFWPANQSIIWTHVTLLGVSTETTYKIVVLAKNGVSDVNGLGFYANTSLMTTIPLLTTESPINAGTNKPYLANRNRDVSLAIGISVICTFFLCLIIGLIVAYFLVLKYRNKVHLSSNNWTRCSMYRNNSHESAVTELSAPRRNSHQSTASSDKENPEISIDEISKLSNDADRIQNSDAKPVASKPENAWVINGYLNTLNIDSKIPDQSTNSFEKSTSSVRSWFPQNDVQYGI